MAFDFPFCMVVEVQLLFPSTLKHLKETCEHFLIFWSRKELSLQEKSSTFYRECCMVLNVC
jgi:hypothetical protein